MEGAEEIRRIKQHPDFPNKVFAIIISERNKNTISLYDYEMYYYKLIFGNKFSKLPYYVGFVYHTLTEDRKVIHALIKTDYDLQLFSILEFEPQRYIKVITENDVFYFVTNFEFKEEDKEALKSFFDKCEIEVHSKEKAKALLAHSNKLYWLEHKI